MEQIYFLFVVLLVVMTACGGKKEASVDAEQLMFQIDSVDHVTGLCLNERYKDSFLECFINSFFILRFRPCLSPPLLSFTSSELVASP